MERLTLALWAVNMADAPPSLDAIAARVEARLAEAAAGGAAILMLPELWCEQWLPLAPPDLPETEEIAWMGAQGARLLDDLRPLPARHGVALMAGSWPARSAAGWVNRAHLLLPEGRVETQDKLCLTPSERDPEAWTMVPGDALRVVTWRGMRLVMPICLDIEQPALAAALQPLDLDLLLVPSMTSQASGQARVTGCAKARAVELMATVATVGCIGSAVVPRPRPNVGGAAAYLPCEPSLGHTGIAVEALWSAHTQGPGPLILARDLPITAIRALRHGGAEVWPGPWAAAHVRIEES